MDLIEQVQYEAALVISGCWQGASRVKLYNELGWESLSDRRWFRRHTPEYLYKHIRPRRKVIFNLRIRRDFANPIKKTLRYENSFFPYCISEWKTLVRESKDCPLEANLRVSYFYSFVLLKGLFFGINNIHGIKLLTKLRVEFSDLRSHKFEHNFNCVDPRCSCLLEDENNPHYLLRCPHYLRIRQNFLGDKSTIIGSDISVLPHDHLTDILLFGSNIYNNVANATNVTKLIWKQNISYIRKSNRFDDIESFSF